jgi:hypothetical protein
MVYVALTNTLPDGVRSIGGQNAEKRIEAAI